MKKYGVINSDAGAVSVLGHEITSCSLPQIIGLLNEHW